MKQDINNYLHYFSLQYWLMISKRDLYSIQLNKKLYFLHKRMIAIRSKPNTDLINFPFAFLKKKKNYQTTELNFIWCSSFFLKLVKKMSKNY